jgi:hypothetical protein
MPKTNTKKKFVRGNRYSKKMQPVFVGDLVIGQSIITFPNVFGIVIDVYIEVGEWLATVNWQTGKVSTVSAIYLDIACGIEE